MDSMISTHIPRLPTIRIVRLLQNLANNRCVAESDEAQALHANSPGKRRY
jgi:hypothetical protein